MTAPPGGSGRAAFAAILAPLSLDRFLADSFGRRPLHLRGSPGRFAHLLDWDGLARLLERHPLEPPRLSVVRAGQTIPAERYLRRRRGFARIDGGALSLLLDAGATAIVNHVDDLVPAIAALADAAGDCLGARTAVNLYATWRDAHGFGPHFDHHDVIVLQLAGRKRWTVHAPTRPDPLNGDPFEPPTADALPELVQVLGDGDVLYLPRGWIHAPVPVGEPSLHLTLSITRPTGAGFLAWLAGELRADPQVRATIPPPGDPAALAAWQQRIATIVAAALEDGAAGRFLVHQDAERGARPRLAMPGFGRTSASAWTGATMLRPASLHRFVLEPTADGARLVTAGRAWPCSAAVAAALGRLTSTKPQPLGALEAGLEPGDAAQLRQLLALLMGLGLLSAEAPATPP